MPGCAYMDLKKWFDNFHISESELREIIGSLAVASPGLIKSYNPTAERFLDAPNAYVRMFYNENPKPVIWHHLISWNDTRDTQISITIFEGNGYTSNLKMIYYYVSGILLAVNGGDGLKDIGPLIQPPYTTVVLHDLNYQVGDAFNARGTYLEM